MGNLFFSNFYLSTSLCSGITTLQLTCRPEQKAKLERQRQELKKYVITKQT